MNRRARQIEDAAKMLGADDHHRYSTAAAGDLVAVTIRKTKVRLRKGTPDIMVALSCLEGEFDPVAYLLPRDYDGVIIDAGGYIGTAALALARLFPKARILTVEPSQANFSLLVQNVANHPRIEPVYGALVADAAKTVTLRNRGTGEWGFTAVAVPDDNPRARDLHETPAFRLADLVADVRDIGLLKLDIEGGELDLLNRDRDTLDLIPNIFIELHDRIALGCRKAFFEFSAARIVVKSSGEKYLSIKR
jgi:FkbM family methyltransferase